MSGAIVGIVAIAVLLALGFYFPRGGGSVPGGKMDDPALPGPYGPILPPEPVGGQRESAGDSGVEEVDTRAEAELWQRERDRYKEKNESP